MALKLLIIVRKLEETIPHIYQGVYPHKCFYVDQRKEVMSQLNQQYHWKVVLIALCNRPKKFQSIFPFYILVFQFSKILTLGSKSLILLNFMRLTFEKESNIFTFQNNP